MYILFIFTFTVYCMSYMLVQDYFSRNAKILINILLAVFFALLIACRPLSIPDTNTYVSRYLIIDSFTNYPVDSFRVPEFSFEIGFVKFIQFIKLYIGGFYRIFLFIIPMINVSLIYLALKRIMKHVNDETGTDGSSSEIKLNFVLMLTIYSSYYGLLYNGIVLRAGLVLSLFFYALAKYMDKKYIEMIIIFIISFLFHRMSLIGMLVIAVYHFAPVLKRKQYFYIWAAIVLLMISHLGDKLINLVIISIQTLFNKVTFLTFSHYLYNYAAYAQIGVKNIFFLFIGLVLLMWEINSRIYYKLVDIYYLGLLLMDLINNIAGSSRIYDFMTIYMVIALYILFDKGKKDKKYKWVLLSAIVLIGNMLIFSVWRLI